MRVLNPFLAGLAAVLLYDIFWFAVLHAAGSARKWALINGATVLCCGLLLAIFALAGRNLITRDPATAQLAEFVLVLLPVAWLSAIDIREMIKGD